MAADPYVILCEANPQVCLDFAQHAFEEPVQCVADHLSGYAKAVAESTPPSNTITLFLHPRYHKVAGLERFLGGLTLLRLIRCRITNIEEAAKVTGLRFLWLDDNRITHVAELSALPRLEYLSLPDNHLTDKSLSDLKSTSLRGLNVANNPVFYTTWLANLPNLVHLDISRTNISNFNALPVLCPKLYSVDISATRVYNFVSLLNMLHGSFPMLRSIHVESRAGRTPFFELMSFAEIEQFFAYVITKYDLQLRTINGLHYTASDITKNYSLCCAAPSVKQYKLISLMLNLDLNQFIAACDAYTRPFLREIYKSYERLKCDLMDLRLLLLCKEHVNDYISATEAENAEGMRRDFAELHKLGFVELNNLNQGLAAALALLRQLYLRYHEVVGLSFLKIDLFKAVTGLSEELFPQRKAQLEDALSRFTVFSTLHSNRIADTYFSRQKYQALEISETCIAPTLNYLEEISSMKQDPLMYVCMSDIFDMNREDVYKDTAFPLNIFGLVHEIIGANIICATGKVLNLNVIHRSAIVKAEATEETNEKITEVLTEDIYKQYFQMASKTTQRQHHPFNIRPGLRRIPLYDEGQLLDLIAKIRIGEPLVLIAVKLSDQTIAVHDGRKHLDINTTMYTTVGTTIIYRKGPVSKVAQKSRAEQLSETVVECSPMVATEHRIPLFYSSHDPLLQWLLTMVWQQYKTHIDALSNVIPDSAIACTEVGQENTSPRGVKSRPGPGHTASIAPPRFTPLVNLIAHQGQITPDKIATERDSITVQQPASTARMVDLHNCGLTSTQLQEHPDLLSSYSSAERLSLACNLLTSVSISLPSLKCLDLSSNMLKEIAIDCPNLIFFDVSSNNISYVSDLLRGLSAATRQSLRHIVIFDNPFTIQSSINLYYALHIIGFLPSLQSINGRMIKPLIARKNMAGNPAMLCEVFNITIESKDLTEMVALLDLDNASPWMTETYNLMNPSSASTGTAIVARTYFELSPVILGHHINYSMIGAFDIPKTLPDTLLSVDLSYNFVVKPSNLLSYGSIQVLNLSNCKITSKTLDLLAHSLDRLVDLDISCNNITSINSLATYSETLTTLHMNCNPGLEIDTLPDLPQLRTVSCLGIKSSAEKVAITLSNRCSNCTHVILPPSDPVPGIIYMLPLQCLNCVSIDPSTIRQNRLKLVGSLNQEIVTSLNAWNGKNTLSLSNSGIMTLNFEKSISHIVTAAETIFASGNAITNISSLKEFSSLIQIDLSYNKISDPFNGLKSNTLEALNVSYNPIGSIKVTNTMLPCLKCLILRGCNISSLPNNAFSAVGRMLTYLDIGENPLITVSKDCFSGLVKLKTLKCDLCNIRSVEFLEPLTSYGTLLLLDLRANKIHNGDKTLDTLKKLRSLTKLFVAENPFSVREKNIAEFRVKLFYTIENLVELEGIAKTAEEVSRLEQYIQWRLEKDAKSEVQIVRFTIGDAAHSTSQPVLPLVKNDHIANTANSSRSTERPSIGATRRFSGHAASKPTLNGIVITGITRKNT
ncbi:Leucine-rich repeat protein [Giardia duodenalis]|uniref:Leucine-rich repeat protein n=1 Tax=Giardia intestinalis (strain ATCC 50803 / WB clone C6) TaxID=184922 RepID=A8BHS8_GIAIC|nr:Leucine-rich repeat protein [Giardia intestinalis]KAE8302635.1 Leucine-rich repeat protein [Giardia intestinalis]|eukprot:XP_001706918.1 Hypothetical protein GL50803_5543 [Giardia lamblia ATCC 50803]